MLGTPFLHFGKNKNKQKNQWFIFSLLTIFLFEQIKNILMY